jgi:hypothetical protein
VHTTAPTAASNLSLQNWSPEFIITEQESDPVLLEVKQWLATGQRPVLSDLRADTALRCYYQQFDSLTVIDNIMYRKFVDVRGSLNYYQLLLPASMRASFLELVHATALCHAKMLQKNEARCNCMHIGLYGNEILKCLYLPADVVPSILGGNPPNKVHCGQLVVRWERQASYCLLI